MLNKEVRICYINKIKLYTLEIWRDMVSFGQYTRAVVLEENNNGIIL